MTPILSDGPFYLAEQIVGVMGVDAETLGGPGTCRFPIHMDTPFFEILNAFQVRTVYLVDDNTPSPGDVADDTVAWSGGAALTDLDHHVVFIPDCDSHFCGVQNKGFQLADTGGFIHCGCSVFILDFFFAGGLLSGNDIPVDYNIGVVSIQPVPYLVPGPGAPDMLEPVDVGMGAGGCENLNGLGVLQRPGEGDDGTIGLGTHAVLADFRMDVISQVDGCRSLGEFHRIAFRCVDDDGVP